MIVVAVPKPQIDLSFSRYVAARKGEASTRSREGAVYAYAGDLKVRATLDRVRPVTLAVEATVRLWQTVEKSRMLGTAVKVTEKQFPKVWKLGVTCVGSAAHPDPDAVRLAQHRLAQRPHLRHRRRPLYRRQRGAHRPPVRRRAARRHRPRMRPHPEQPRGLYDHALLPDPRGEHVPALERQAGGDGAQRLGAARGDHLRSHRPHLHARPRRVDRLPGQAGDRLAQAVQRHQPRRVPGAARGSQSRPRAASTS